MADRLDELKARLAAATGPPWGLDETRCPEISVAVMAGDEFIAMVYGEKRYPHAELIANAPADLTYLIAEVERLRAELEWIAERVSDDEPGDLSPFRPGWEAGNRAREALVEKGGDTHG